MTIALIEDDISQSEILAKMLSENLAKFGYSSCSIAAFRSGEEFLTKWQPGDYDIILLDIFMQSLSGVETAKKIREKDKTVCLVFCTGSNEFASESYEVNASYYICKPITNEVVVAMLKRLNLELLEKKQFLKLPDGDSVLLHDIIYTEYSNHVVTIYLKNDAPYRLRTSQAQMESLLLARENFFSPIKGIIINFDEVIKKSDENFILSNNKIVHITRRKAKDAREAYTRFRFDKMRKEVAI